MITTWPQGERLVFDSLLLSSLGKEPFLSIIHCFLMWTRTLVRQRLLPICSMNEMSPGKKTENNLLLFKQSRKVILTKCSCNCTKRESLIFLSLSLITLPNNFASFYGNFLSKFHKIICEENQKAEQNYKKQSIIFSDLLLKFSDATLTPWFCRCIANLLSHNYELLTSNCAMSVQSQFFNQILLIVIRISKIWFW